MNQEAPTPSPSDGELAGQLDLLLQAIEAGSKAVLPSSNDELLRSIVEAAARIFGAGAAAILLVDEDEEQLVFRVAIGKNNPKDLVGTRIPLQKGIAGYVAMTGQALAVSNTQNDARFNAEFAKSTGYVPQSILAAPLLMGDRVIGVMEVLDKINADSFGMQDMELLGLFAQQAALAINQSQQLDRVGEALVRGLRGLAKGEGLPDSSAIMSALEKSQGRRATAESEDLLDLAGLFHDLSSLGPNERRASLKILTAMAEYSQSRNRSRF